MARPVSHGGRDYPDYGVSQVSNTKGFVLDLSELASRLGSPNYFDRRGTQLFMESWGSGIQQWSPATVGGGSSVSLRADHTDLGPYAVRLTCGNNAGDNASITRRLPYPYLSNLGFEFHIKVHTVGDTFYALLNLYDGAYWTPIYFRLNADAEYLRYYAEGPVWRTLDVSPLYTGADSQFHAIKCRVDLESWTWSEIMFDTADYDVSAYGLHRAANVTNERMEVYFSTQRGSMLSAVNVVDNVIVTLDEPS